MTEEERQTFLVAVDSAEDEGVGAMADEYREHAQRSIADPMMLAWAKLRVAGMIDAHGHCLGGVGVFAAAAALDSQKCRSRQ